MDRPDATLIRSILPKAPWATFGFAAPDPAPPDPHDDPMDFQVQLAADYVEWVTGRPQDATMPDPLMRTAQMADALRVVQQLSDAGRDQIDAYAESDVLASFSADGYSETYRDTGVSAKAMMDGRLVNPWPPLNRLLWMLMTPARLVYWMGFLEGGGIPQWGVAEVDWSGANRWGGIPGRPGDGGMAGDEALGGTDTYGTRYPTGSNTGVELPGDGIGG